MIGLYSNDRFGINVIVEQIENEVFNNENPDSLLSLAQCNNWQNDIIEETSEEATTTERGLTIIFPDKTVFKNRNAIEAFKLALEKIGLEEISNREDLKHSGYNLVGKTQRPPVPGRTWQHLYKGWFIYSNISNDDKRDDLTILCPDIKVLDGVQDVDEIEDINN